MTHHTRTTLRALAALALIPAGYAQQFFNGGSAWNTGTSNWSATSNGPYTAAWANLGGSAATFVGTPSTVTVGTVNAANLTFGTAGYNLNGGTISITANRSLVFQNGGLTTIGTAIAGNFNMTFTGAAITNGPGAGTLTLSGTNTYSGTTTINGGTVNVSSLANNFGSNLTLNIGNGGNLNYTGAGENTARVVNLSGSNTNSTLTQSGSGHLKFTANFTALKDGNKTLFLAGSSAGTGEIAGAIVNSTGTTSLTKSGTGTWTLSGANTYTGTTTVNGGTLTLGNALALQNSALDTAASVTGSATAGLKTTVTSLTLGGLNGNKNLANLFTTSSGGYNTVTDLTLNPGTGVTNTYNGIIADGAAGMTLTKTGGGTQILSGANTYTGLTTVSAGTLETTGATATFGNGDIMIGNGATLSLGNGNSIADTANVSFDVGATLLLGTGITETVNTLSSFSGTFIGAGTYDASALQSFFGSGSFAGLGQLTVLTTSAVPEPSTYAVLAGLGILGFAVYRRRSAA